MVSHTRKPKTSMRALVPNPMSAGNIAPIPRAMNGSTRIREVLAYGAHPTRL